MELNLTTFILEIVNFLVLVWLLQRFFYKPVLDVIAKRKAGIDQALEEAARVQKEASTLQAQCNERLSQWEEEKRTAMENLQREIDAQRRRMMEELGTTLENERQKQEIIEQKRKADDQRKLETLALTHGAAFASKLLQHSAGPELESRLFDLLLQEMDNLPADTIESLRPEHQQDLTAITVLSAYPLSDQQRTKLQQHLDTLLGTSLPYDYRQNAELLAGLRIIIGAWVLRVNLQDELHDFTQFVHV